MFYDAQRKPSVASIEEQMANVSLNLSDAGDGRGARFTKETTKSSRLQSQFLSQCHVKVGKDV